MDLEKRTFYASFFNKGIFTSIEINQKLPKFDSALPANELVETITFENALSDHLRSDILIGGVYNNAMPSERNNHQIHSDPSNDVLIGRSSENLMLRNEDLNYERSKQANDQSIRKFNVDTMDQFMLDTVAPGGLLPSSGNGIVANDRGNLMSVLEEPLGELQRSSDFLL